MHRIIVRENHPIPEEKLSDSMPSSRGSSVSGDDEMGLSQKRAQSTDFADDKVVEKSPKGRFHRVC